MEGVGDGFDEGVAWDAEEVRKDLADDAGGEKYRAKEKKGELGEVDVGDEGARQKHAEVDAESEERGGRDLPELEGGKGSAEDEELAEDEEEIHTECEGSVGEGRDGGEDPRDGRDGGCAEARLGGAGDAEAGEDDTEGEERGPAAAVEDEFFNCRRDFFKRFVFHKGAYYTIFQNECVAEFEIFF